MIVTGSRLAVATLALCLVSAGQSFAAQQAPPLPPRSPLAPLYLPPAAQDLSGVWRIQRYSARILPTSGGEIPFTAEGRTRFQANMAALRADPLANDEARKNCVPEGVPRILGNPYPFQILQTRGQVTIVYEINRTLRRILLDHPQAAAEHLEFVPFYSGYSIGHWEGDTLVIETAGFNEKTFLDNSGLPHSAKLTTVERVRKRDAKTLEVVVTISDPVTFTQPWDARFVYDLHPELRLQDYVCGDVHRDISDVPGVVPRN
jgi:hypothetical protein